MNNQTPPVPAMTRRDFLKNSTVAASAAALGTLDLSRSAYAAGSDILKVGMIGCGGRNGGAAVQALTADPGARLVAMCDIFRDRINTKREEIKAARGAQVTVDDNHCFTGFDAYKQVIEASDVVVIANAAKFHPFHAMTAIKAGKHVFVEKPHGIDPAGVRMMQQACDLAKEKKLCIVSGLQSRFHSGYIETVKRIQDGAIGDIITIEENFLRAPYGVTERKPGLSELEWQCSTQYHFRWLSGDDVPQSLVHNMDRASWVLGNKVPLKCHGLAGRSTMAEPIYGDVFDHHSVVYEFENGVRVYALCRTTAGCYDEDSSLIFGSKGKASLKACRIWGETAWRWQGQCDPYQIEHNKLFAAIRACEPINCGDYMARSTMITVMGQISCYTGKEVTWEQINQSDFYHAPKPEDCHDGMEPPTKPDASGSYPVPFPGRTKMI
ncbi:MAG TPA: Gfo/Idh/MocA family oxidoreductase [Candidatus Sulfotelmatobacter sp.]|nr:Gfo/Idh/MocA family oxidoreductase [Candidatus Sulfotelmatobacter sp.]